ncbi:MAG: hypothetical protein ABSB61_08715 [Anaerolineales bacterium]|jgi:hypothetical protein
MTDGTVHLALRRPSPARKRAITEAFLDQVGAPPAPAVEIQAGRHRAEFKFESEIRFGPPYYRARVEGPNGLPVSKFLKDRFFFLSGSPYHPDMDWFAFEEIEEVPAGPSILHFFDLSTGELISSLKEGGYGFSAWRPRSPEAILHRLVDIRRLSWYALDPRSPNARYLTTGGSNAYLGSDGTYLLVMDPRAFFVALVDASSGKLLDWKTNKDFAGFTSNPETLQVVRFRGEEHCLQVLLNWRGTDRRKRTVNCDAVLEIDVEGRAPE